MALMDGIVEKNVVGKVRQLNPELGGCALKAGRSGRVGDAAIPAAYAAVEVRDANIA